MKHAAPPLRRQTAAGMDYERRGDGPTVVLLHGWSLCGRLWMYEEERLAGGHDVITPDLPGLGRSDGMSGPYTVERHAAAVGELLAEADVQDAVLVGFAYGAAVGTVSALADASRIAGLALVGLPGPSDLPIERMLSSMRRDWPGYARRSAEALCAGQSEATVRWLESLFVANRLPVAVETWTDISRFDPVPLAPRIAVPALFMHGENDDFAPLAVAQQCAAAAPAGRLELASGSGHLLPIEQPDWLHDKLQAFVSEVT